LRTKGQRRSPRFCKSRNESKLRLAPAVDRPVTIERVLVRLDETELREPDIWFRQDVRPARIVVALARKNDPQPFVTSSYTVYACHPDHVCANILRNRRAKLGDEYDLWYDSSGMMRPDVLKKPSIVFDEEAEQVRLGVLMFPKTALQFAEMEQKSKKGTLLEMPSSTQIEARKSLRILPA